MQWKGTRLTHEPCQDFLYGNCRTHLAIGKTSKNLITKMVPCFPFLVTKLVSPGDSKKTSFTRPPFMCNSKSKCPQGLTNSFNDLVFFSSKSLLPFPISFQMPKYQKETTTGEQQRYTVFCRDRPGIFLSTRTIRQFIYDAAIIHKLW